MLNSSCFGSAATTRVVIAARNRTRSRTRSRSRRFRKIRKGGTLNPLNDVLGIFDTAKYQVSSAASTFTVKPAADSNPSYPIDPNPGKQFL